MTDLPPAPGPNEEVTVRRRTVERKTRLWPVFLFLALLFVAVLAFAWWMKAPEAKPVAAPKPSPRAAAPNACAHDTFDANGCAVRILTITVRQTQTAPAVVVQAFCEKYEGNPGVQRELVDKWESQGAYRSEARAVINEILDYCSQVEAAG